MCKPQTVQMIATAAGGPVGGAIAGLADPIKNPVNGSVPAPTPLNLPSMYPGSVNGMSGSAISPLSTPPPQGGNWQDMFMKLLKQFSGQ
jgi:hypothetical protein